MSTVDDFVNESGGLPTVKFEQVGATLVADLLEARVGIQRKFGSPEPDTWPDGTPRKQLQLDLKVDRAESNDIVVGKDNTEEVGTHYAKHELKLALRDACEEEGCKLSQVGRVKIRRLEDGDPPKPGFNGKQQFKAKVWPKANTEADDLDDF